MGFEIASMDNLLCRPLVRPTRELSFIGRSPYTLYNRQFVRGRVHLKSAVGKKALPLTYGSWADLTCAEGVITIDPGNMPPEERPPVREPIRDPGAVNTL